MRRYFVVALFATLALAACEGARNNDSWSHRKPGTAIVPPLQTKAAPTDSTRADSAAGDTSQAKH